MTLRAEILTKKKRKRCYDELIRVVWHTNDDLRKQYLGPKSLTKKKRCYYELIRGIMYNKTDLKKGLYTPNLDEVMAKCLMPRRK